MENDNSEDFDSSSDDVTESRSINDTPHTGVPKKRSHKQIWEDNLKLGRSIFLRNKILCLTLLKLRKYRVDTFGGLPLQ